MAEQDKSIKLSEYLQETPQSDTSSQPIKLSEYGTKKLSEVDLTKKEEVGALESLYRIGGGAIRDTAQATKDATAFLLRTQGKYSPVKQRLSQIIDATPDLPEVEEPTSIIGGITRDIAGFAIPYTPAVKTVQAVRGGTSLLQKGINATVAGSAAEQFAFSPTEERLSNLIQSVPALQNPVTDFLEAEENDTESLGRLKMAIEGTAFAGLFELIFAGVRGLKNVRKKKPSEEMVETSEEAIKKADEADKNIEKVIPRTEPEDPTLTVEQVQQQRKKVTKTPFTYDRDTNTYKAKIKKNDYEIRESDSQFRIFKSEPLTPQQIDDLIEQDKRFDGELTVEELKKRTQMLPFERTFSNIDQAKRFVVEEGRPSKLPKSLRDVPEPKVRRARDYIFRAIDPNFKRKSELADALGGKIPLSYLRKGGAMDFDEIAEAMDEDQFFGLGQLERATLEGRPQEDITEEVIEALYNNSVHINDQVPLQQARKINDDIEQKRKLLTESFGIRPDRTTDEEVEKLLKSVEQRTEALELEAKISDAETKRARLIEQDIREGNVGLPSLKDFKDPEIQPTPMSERDLADVIPRVRTEFEDYVKDVDIDNKFTEEVVPPTAPGRQPEKKSKYIINVNMNRLDASIPERKTLEKIAEEYEEPLEVARNVTKFGSNGENLKALAEETGLPLEQLLKGEVGKVLDPVNMYRLRVAHAEALKEVTDLTAAMKDTSKATPELKYEFDVAITRYVGILEKLVGQAAEAGRVLKSFDVPVKAEDGRKTKLITKYFKENKGRSDILDVMADAISKLDDPQQVSKFLREAWKPSTLDKIQEAWINALLSAPPTHIVNMLGNASNILLSVGEQGTAAIFGLLRGAKEADRLTFKELGARMIGNILGFADGLKAGAKALIDEEYITDPFLKVELARQRAIGGITGKIVRIPTRALAAEDLFFKAINYRQDVMGLATRQAIKEGKQGLNAVRQRVKEILDNPMDELPDLDLKATDYARYQTYTNPLGKFGQSLQNQLSEPYFKVFRFIAPFIRTPVNIVKYAGERTPLGFIFKRYKDAIEAGGAEADIAKAKIAFTGGVMSVLGLYASQGLITGRGPEDVRERAVLRETGWQEYSIKVGDEYISYQRFEPFGILLGLTADFVTASQMIGDNVLVSEGEEQKSKDTELQEELSKVGAYLIASFADNITNKTYLRGVSDVIKAIDDPERYGPTYLNNFLSSPIPNVSGYIRRMDDPYVRDVRGLTDALMNKIPGISVNLPTRRNIFGEPIKYTPGAAPEALGRFGEVFSPARKEQITNDIVFNELLDIEYYPSMPRRTIQGVDLNSDQYEYMMAQHVLQRTKQQILDEILSPGYKELPKYQKKKMIKRIIEGNNEIARFETWSRYPELQEKIELIQQAKLEE